MAAHILLEVGKITANFNQESLIDKLTRILEEVAKLSVTNDIRLELDLGELSDKDLRRFAEIFALAADPVQEMYGSIWKYVALAKGTLASEAILLERSVNPVLEKDGVQQIEDLVDDLESIDVPVMAL